MDNWDEWRAEREKERLEKERLKAEEETRMALEVIEFMQNLWYLYEDTERFDWTEEEGQKQAKAHNKRLAFLREHLPGHKEFEIPVSGSMVVHAEGTVKVKARTKDEAESIAQETLDCYLCEVDSDIGHVDRWIEYVEHCVNERHPGPTGVVGLYIQHR